MSKIVNYIAGPADHNQLLGSVLKSGLGLTTRQIRTVKFVPGGLTINGQRYRDGRLITTRAAVRQGDVITVSFPQQPETVIPVAGPLQILYEDEDLLAIQKPAGLVCHPAHGHYTDTLANRIAARQHEAVHLIGRLDKDTSGLILCAKNAITQTRLEQQRSQGKLTRRYLALVKGALSGRGYIDMPLQEKRGDLLKVEPAEQGKASLTEYKVWHTFDHAALVELRLQTGRTHQIRAHMAAIGHPLLGDALYGAGAEEGFNRAALHSVRITFEQPFGEEKIDLWAMPPQDFCKRWERESMKDLTVYMQHLTFPQEAMESVKARWTPEIEVLAHRYMEGEISLKEALASLGEEEWEQYLCFLLAALPELKARYQKAGLEEELFWHTMMDLKYKLMECHTVKGVWGNFAAWWYDKFFTMERFALGRLQFEVIPFPEERYEAGGIVLKKGDAVVNMHIPSAGPLTRQLREDAYQKAYHFFAAQRTGDLLPLVCTSWLLDPDYQSFLQASSNILDFQRDFNIIKTGKDETFHDAWRVFGAEAQKPVKDLPRRTSLQRGFADFLAGGGQTGWGLGVILWRGDRECSMQ